MTRVLLALLALALSGCLQPRISGHFGEGAYYHGHDHYRVRYDEGGALLGAPWALTSFQRDGDGRPTRALDGEEWVSRYDLIRYARTRGNPVMTLARWDVLLEHAETGSVVFARTVPLRDPWLADSLPVLMQRSVVSLGSYEADGPDLLGRPRAPAGQRVRILSEGPQQVDGEPAYVVRFQLERAQLDGRSEVDDVTIVGVRAPRDIVAGRGRPIPTLMVFGLIAPDEEARAVDRAALASLVRRVDFAP